MGIFNRVLQQLKGQNEPVFKPGNHQDSTMTSLQQHSELIRLQDERQPVELVTANRYHRFQTVILGLDMVNRQLLLDEPIPRLQSGEDFIGQLIQIRHQLHHTMLSFYATVLDYNPVDNTLVIELPEHASYRARRQEPRLYLGNQRAQSAHVYPIYGAPWYSAAIQDIGPGGMRISVPDDLRNYIHKDLVLKRCEFSLDYHGSASDIIRCRGSVRSFRFNGRPYRHTLVSIMFEDLNPEARDIIEQFMDQTSLAA